MECRNNKLVLDRAGNWDWEKLFALWQRICLIVQQYQVFTVHQNIIIKQLF